MVLPRANESGVLLGHSLGESFLVRLYMVFENQMGNSEASFLIKRLQVLTNSLHLTERRCKPGGRAKKKHGPGFEG